MASGQQISSLHLAIAAGGGLLLYAALRGVSPLQALKDVTSGAPPAVATEGKSIKGPGGATDPDALPGGEGGETWNGVYKKRVVPPQFQSRALLVTAANIHATEKYSQVKRWKPGFSDCSSFIGKSLLDIGIAPPGGSTTHAFLSSADWVKVSKPQMGDLAVNGKHVALFIDGKNGIGMQNSRKNVQRGPMDDLMANTGSWEIRRYRRWA